jgi:hypothetical protein
MGRYKRKRKFTRISFKLSDRQMKSLKNYCEARQTTPNKLIKKSIKFYTENFEKSVPEKYHVTHNQLNMFEDDQETLSLFD